VLDLAKIIWEKIHKGSLEFKFKTVEGFPYDVKKRIPDVSKARYLLDFEAKTTLNEMLDEVIPWIKSAIESKHI
jgi:nucleoside-diphosphate-sugar epimerase